MKKISIKPNKFLSQYIDRIYSLEYVNVAETELPSILPGTGLELMFHMRKPFSHNGNITSNAHIICPRKSVQLDNTNYIQYVSVRFKCGTFRHFSPLPYTELNNSFLSAYDIWGIEGKYLEECISEAESFEQKVLYLDNFLIKCFKKYNKVKFSDWDFIINSIYKNDDVSLTEFANKLNLSFRQFERNFKNYYGITPVKFRRIARFQKTVKSIIYNQKQNGYLPTILDKGYYDQSHFIKEFNNLVGSNPGQYFKNELYSVKYFDESTYNWMN